ncbi:MAG TPA: hypothetical protein VKG87_01480 [Terriglobales bacterium]|nr:hypothetical protein [Terriglobales bacterium]
MLLPLPLELPLGLVLLGLVLLPELLPLMLESLLPELLPLMLESLLLVELFFL